MTRSLKRSAQAPSPHVIEDQQPSKRSRSDPTPGAVSIKVALSDLVKHQPLWFSDGNIVLAAGSVCFKVHRSQLARFCTVFEDMFGAPASGGFDEEMMEGSVVVRMPDTAGDLTSFLEAMYNGHSFDFSTKDAANFSAAAGVMHLATKYECEVLRNRVMTSLRGQYPSHLEPYVFGGTTRHVNVLLLARECDLLDLLPSCFYQLAFALESVEPVALLAPNDRKRLETGRKSLLKQVEDVALEGSPGVSPSCQNAAPHIKNRHARRGSSNKCAQFLDLHWKNDFNSGEGLSDALARDPLKELTSLSYRTLAEKRLPQGARNVSFNESPLCLGCSQRYTEYMRATTQRIWDSVPEYFML